MGYNNAVDVDVNKDICVDIDVYENFDFNVYLDKCVDVDVKVDSCADIKGNVALLEGTCEAFGCNTLAEVTYTCCVVEDKLSEVSICAQAATEGWSWFA